MTETPDSHASTETPEPSNPRPVASPEGGEVSGFSLRQSLDLGPTTAFMAGLFVLGFVVFFPSIRAPLLLDDYIHRAMAHGVFPAPRGPFDLYDFVSFRDRSVLVDRGILPWWTDPSLEIRFFRPLSSLLLYVDHRTMGTSPFLLHIHSFLWWMLAVLGARGLFSRFLPPRVVLIATTVFALAPCHAVPLAWLANREALVSLAFGLSALGKYEDFRASRSLRDGLFAAILFSLALLAGEYTLLMVGYVGALELYRAPKESPARRATGLAPFVLPVIGYLVARNVLGYGTAGSAVYSDPTREPLLYVTQAPRRIFTLAADAWLSLDQATIGASVSTWTLVFVVLVGVLFVGKPVKEAIFSRDDRSRRFLLALLLGSFASFLPILAVVPSPRLLGTAMVGVAAIVAVVLDHVWISPTPANGHTAIGERTAAAALAFGFFHLVHAPINSWVSASIVQKGAVRFAYYATKLGGHLAERPDAEVIVARNLGTSTLFVPFAVTPNGAPPAKWRTLAETGHMLVNREDERTFTLTVPEGASVFPIGRGNLFRPQHATLAPGAVLVGQRMRAEILAVNEGGPSKVRFIFDVAPDEAIWISETSKGFPETPPPEPGFGAPFDP